MFYRFKFDGFVAEVLNGAGYVTTEDKLRVWPAGLSRSLIIAGKKAGLNAETAAFQGMMSHYGDMGESELAPAERHNILRVLTSHLTRLA